MIFEMLDVKKRRIGTYTEQELVRGSVRRELVDRVVKDSMDVEFTIKMLDVIRETAYIMVGDVGFFRTNPIYKIVDIKYGETVEVMTATQTIGREDDKVIKYEEGESLYGLINRESGRLGYSVKIELESNEAKVTEEVFKYVDKESFRLEEIIKAILQVTGSQAEFDTFIKNDYVANTQLRISDRLGNEYKDALIEGVNITSLDVSERMDDIITAVEYTGRQLEEGSVDEYLTLNPAGKGVPTSYILPKTKRRVNLTNIEEDGKKRYLLEDKDSTRLYGMYTGIGSNRAKPKIKVRSNKDVPTIEDLIELSIKELDGETIPKTVYTIEATVRGLDVADELGIKIPRLKIDRTLPVLSVEYDMEGELDSYIKVGEELKSELDKKFEKLEERVGEEKEKDKDEPDTVILGEKMSQVMNPRDVTFALGREVVFYNWNRSSGSYSLGKYMYRYDGRGIGSQHGASYNKYEQQNITVRDRYLSGNMPQGLHLRVSDDDWRTDNKIFKMEFDYKINGGYEATRVVVSAGSGSTGGYPLGWIESKEYVSRTYDTIIADKKLEGSSGKVELIFNEYENFTGAGFYDRLTIFMFINKKEGDLNELNLYYVDAEKDYLTTEKKDLTGYLENVRIDKYKIKK